MLFWNAICNLSRAKVCCNLLREQVHGGGCPGLVVQWGIIQRKMSRGSKVQVAVALTKFYGGWDCLRGNCPGGNYSGVIFRG